MSCKITLIGAGSVVFAKTMVCDLLQFPEFRDLEISLMDIDPVRLKIAEAMMKRVAAKLNVPATITATTDRREAIRCAKYVLCTIQVGGYKPSTVRDFEIPAKYGLQQTIGDTLGIGGIFRGLRTIPVMLDIARDIADVAHPDCLFLNYTNPMAILCMAVDRAVGIPHVGLCHSVFGTARMLAGHTGLPYEDLSYLVAGVNHMAFFLEFKYKGQDAYPLLFKILDDPKREFEKVRYEMMRRTGYFVTESSEHQSEYIPYFIHHGQEMIDRFDIPINEYLRRCETINASWESTERELVGEGTEIDVPEQSHEYGSYIIHSIETNTLRTVYGNVPNLGTIENLPASCNVEVPCQVDGTGLRPVKIGTLPPQLAALCQTQINVQELTVQAALTGKREHIYHAAMLDPHTSATLPLDRIWAMCDELIEAHQADGYLGDFAPVVKNTGRSFAGIGDVQTARLKTEGLFDSAVGHETVLKVDTPADAAFSVEFDAALLELVNDEGRRFVLRNRVELEHGAEVGLRCTDPHVFCKGIVLKKQRVAKLDDGFKMDLSGFPAVEGRFDWQDDGLVLSLKINDSDLQVNLHQPWRKSCVEVMFAPDTDSAVRAFYLVPDVKKPFASVGTEFVPKDVTVSVEPSSGFYVLKAVFPFERIGLMPEAKGFLFNFQAFIMALGEAHSGGSCTLSAPGEEVQAVSAFTVIER
jgi:alpha-galactosidase